MISAGYARAAATLLAIALAASPVRVGAQVDAPLNVGTSDGIDRWRLETLVDSAPSDGLLIRSTSSLIASNTRRGPIPARFYAINNSALPLAANDGALWSGRGLSMSLSGGFFAGAGRLRVIVAPEFIHAANRFVERDTPRFYAPDIPGDRSPFTLTWYGGPFSADVPIRFGDDAITRLTPGQSSVAVELGAATMGFATENQWWGPGFRNALVITNAAAGFPHLFVRSRRPLATRLGNVEFKWIVGGLSESAYFDTTSANDLRSLSAAIVTLEPRFARRLTLGLSRSVMGTASGWGEIPLRWLEVLHRVQPANDVPLSDSTMYPGGREEITSLFARLRIPESGVEAHVEIGRMEFPRRPRDFLVAPSHSRAYVAGVQWRSSPASTFWRAQAEITNLEQSSSFRDRPLGVWYTSRRVVQGYTNRGEPVGAGVGPGSSSQWLAFDRFSPTTQWGFYGGRTRHNESVRNIYAFPDYQAYCNHDVDMFYGVRAGRLTRVGYATLDFRDGNRINLWFQVGSGCPRGDTQLDVRNRTISFTLEPFRGRGARRPPR